MLNRKLSASKLPTFHILTVILLVSCTSNHGKYDKRAVAHLDKLSKTIGNLNSCSYTLNTIVMMGDDTISSNENDVYMLGPDKLHVYSVGSVGKKGYWYDGRTFSYFSYINNTFDTIELTGNIITAIDKVHENYGIDFPAADFFYPSFTDDILDNFDRVLLMHDEKVDNVICFVIKAVSDEMVLKIWMAKKTNLPIELLINHKGDRAKSYNAIFSNWRLDPSLPSMLFEFEPPLGSTIEKLQLKN